jgi:hypothetical protein
MTVPIRTNLYSGRLARRQRAAVRSRRALTVVLIVAAALWFARETQRQVEVLRAELEASKATETALATELQAARRKAEAEALHAAARDPVLRVAQGRWNWAPVLERLYAVTPPHIELHSLKIRVLEMDAGILQVSGRSAGARPRVESDKFRLLVSSALAETGCTVSSQFIKLEDSAVTIRFEETDYESADFVLEFTLSDLTHEKRRT